MCLAVSWYSLSVKELHGDDTVLRERNRGIAEKYDTLFYAAIVKAGDKSTEGSWDHTGAEQVDAVL